MDWYKLPVEEVERKLEVFHKKGLTSRQVEERQRKYGLNQIVVSERKPLWLIFISQFQDFLVLILLAATLIAGLLGEYVDALAIMLIVILNGLIGFFQEHRAEKSLEKLKQLSAPTMRVLRDGEWQTLPVEQAVVGDIVRIKTGDRVPADLRVIEANGLETEESMLTGESLPVEKRADAIFSDNLSVQDQANMVFKSTLVTKGSGLGIVVHTGMNTEIGKIAKLMDETKHVPTPLELKLKELGKTLIFVVFMLTALTVFIGVYQGQLLYDMFLAGVSLAVAVIPEGLPAIVTVVLSLGVQRMIKRKAIVRKLSAIETLGSTSVICTDKTGTITQNKMTVKEIWLAHRMIAVSGDGYAESGDFIDVRSQGSLTNDRLLHDMLLYGSLCNSAELQRKKGKLLVDGDPTDGALLIAARKFGITYAEAENFKKLAEIPFDSERKRMSVLIENEASERFLIVKGAPDIILPRCRYELSWNGKQSAIKSDTIMKVMERMAEKALRIIAISVKKLSPHESVNEKTLPNLENELTFIGLFGLLDPPRENVKQAVAQCKQAGIKTVMITGDHKKTALAIAGSVGIYEPDDLVLEGYELNKMSVNDLANIIENVSVFARVTPEHKLKIVKAFQKRGHIVAMTGDGVNDAPAIKAANIGISMGISGTDVTKEASSLVLLDDNFITIKEAIREGRNIYENIRKFIRYLLASNVGEIFVMLAAMILAQPLPLVPVQILWVNLITDGLPAMALGLDPPETNVMKQKPRSPKEGIFSRGLGFKIITRGLLIGLVTLIAFMYVLNEHPEDLNYARTYAFTTLVLAQLIHVFDCRTERGIFTRNPFSNLYLLFAVVLSFLLLLVVIYVKPLQAVFYTVPLQLTDWLIVFVLSALPTLLFSFSKK